MRTNNKITASPVLLIDEVGKQLGVVDLAKALSLARTRKLDLVEVAPSNKPAVCKLLDYGKHAYKEKKKRAEARSRQKQILVKEVKFRASTGKGDFEIKKRKIERFLAAGDKVKVSLWFRGREIVHQRLGHKVLERLCEELVDIAQVEGKPTLEGKRLQLLFSPSKSVSGEVERSGKGNGVGLAPAGQD